MEEPRYSDLDIEGRRTYHRTWAALYVHRENRKASFLPNPSMEIKRYKPRNRITTKR
jgi:hypothetical protein